MRFTKCDIIVDINLGDRIFIRLVCEWVVNRDYNASLNVMKQGSEYQSACEGRISFMNYIL